MNKDDLYQRCFIDEEKYIYKDLIEEIPTELFVRGICVKQDDKLVFKCTGFIVVQNQIYVVFPKGCIIPEDDHNLKIHVRLLINVLMKYSHNKNKLDPIEESLLGGLGDNQNYISAAFWLIEDFSKYGIVDFVEEEYGINHSNNINWARTIKNSQPLISNKNPVYLDLVTKKKVRSKNIISQIHNYVIEECLRMYGWLFEYDNVIGSKYSLPCDEGVAIHLLELEIQNTFEERKLNLYFNLKEFILGSHNESKEEILTFVTPYFHTVWEKMCYFIFSNDDYKLPILPKPFWKTHEKKAETEQIPDIMYKEEETLVIIDAKYYQIKYAPKKLPGWGDLVKQFFYRHTLIKNEEKIIENVFLFPGQTKKEIKYLGYAALEEVDDSFNLGRINGYILDIDTIMYCYVNNDKGNFKNRLSDMIKEGEN